MRRLSFLALVTFGLGCGGPDPTRLAYVLLDEDARAAGLTAPDGRTSALPLIVDPSDEVPASSVAWVHRPGVATEVLRLGLDADENALEITGGARTLADLIGAENDGNRIFDEDLWMLVGDLEASIDEARPIVTRAPTFEAPLPSRPFTHELVDDVGVYRSKSDVTMILDAGGGALIAIDAGCDAGVRGHFERAAQEGTLELDGRDPIRVTLDDGQTFVFEREGALLVDPKLGQLDPEDQ